MDKYYKSIKEDLSWDEMFEAGYIHEFFPNGNLLNFPITPLPLKSDFNKNKKNIILLSTGSFAPIHEGHIEKLKLAKGKLESLGEHVVCAYLSPSHDKYVLNKVKNKKFSALNRLHYIDEAISKEDENWIKVDPWESLFNKEAINFTSVILYLERYIKHHLKNIPDFEIVFVYGSDNYLFGKAFKYHGRAVCVERASSVKKREHNYKNILNISVNKHADKSSTQIRENRLEKGEEHNNGVYLVRDDFYRSLASVESYVSAERYNSFVLSFKELLLECNDLTSNIYILKESEEIRLLKELDLDNYISLDLYHGINKIRLSRLFNLGEIQNHAQTIKISSTPYCVPSTISVFDDDSVSGYTFKTLEKEFSTVIEEKITLAEIVREEHYPKDKIVDVVDIRDFIFGGKEGGLLVQFGEMVFKMPYIFPFVNLRTRMNLKPHLVLYFTKAILDLNISLYKDFDLKLKDFKNNDIIKLGEYFDYDKNSKIIDLINRIKIFLENYE